MKHTSKKAQLIYSLTKVQIKPFIENYKRDIGEPNPMKMGVGLRYPDNMSITMHTLKELQYLLDWDRQHRVIEQDVAMIMQNTIDWAINEEKEWQKMLKAL